MNSVDVLEGRIQGRRTAWREKRAHAQNPLMFPFQANSSSTPDEKSTRKVSSSTTTARYLDPTTVRILREDPLACDGEACALTTTLPSR